MIKSGVLGRAEIVSTLGPSTDNPKLLKRLLLAGVNVVRLNLSRDDGQDHLNRAKRVREIAKKHSLNISILGELQRVKNNAAGFNTGKNGISRGAIFENSSALTNIDYGDICLAAELKVDYLAVSTPCSVESIERTRELLAEVGSEAKIVAKIDNSDPVSDTRILNSFIDASDAVMVARSNLGVGFCDEKFISPNANVIRRAHKHILLPYKCSKVIS